MSGSRMILSRSCRTLQLGFSIPNINRIHMVHLSTAAMAHVSALPADSKPSSWQGAGAAEFDMRSMLSSVDKGLRLIALS